MKHTVKFNKDKRIDYYYDEDFAIGISTPTKKTDRELVGIKELYDNLGIDFIYNTNEKEVGE